MRFTALVAAMAALSGLAVASPAESVTEDCAITCAPYDSLNCAPGLFLKIYRNGCYGCCKDPPY